MRPWTGTLVATIKVLITNNVIFSAWTKTLDLTQQELRGEGIRTLRIDGQSTLEMRRRVVEQFKIEDHYTVLLTSIGVAKGMIISSPCI